MRRRWRRPPSPRRSSASRHRGRRRRGSARQGRSPPSPRRASGTTRRAGRARRATLAEQEPAGVVDERDAGRLRDERHRPRRARVRLEHVQPSVVQRELEVQQSARAEAARRGGAASARISSSSAARDRGRGEHARRVARVDARRARRARGSPRPSRPRRRRARRRRARARPRGTGRRARGSSSSSSSGAADDAHPAPAEHVVRGARAPGSRSAPRPRAPPRVVVGDAPRAARAGRAPSRSAREAAAVLGGVDRRRAGRRAAARPPRRGRAASASGVWPPSVTTTPSGRSSSHDVEHPLERDRLEVEPVAGVVVGRDRLRVRVDEHRLVAEPPERLRRRARSSSRTRSPGRSGSGPSRGRRSSRRARLVAVAGLVREVVVRRPRLELGRAGVDREPPGQRPARCAPPPRRSRARARCASPEARSASPRRRRRRPRARRSASRIDSSSACEVRVEARDLGQRRRPASTPSSAFRKASGNVRPSPSDSPTARISVPSSGSTPGNFSKSKRGALTAT